MNTLVIGVNGYGAPERPEEDGNLGRYLSTVINFCKQQPAEVHIELHLLGGATNRPSLSEARAMVRWLMQREVPPNVLFVLHENTMDLAGNCSTLANAVHPGSEVVYFCEYSRWPATYFMVRSYLRGAKVMAVPFDVASLRWRHRLLQWGPKLFLEVAAEWLGGPFAWLRKRKREAHIEACRRQAAESL